MKTINFIISGTINLYIIYLAYAGIISFYLSSLYTKLRWHFLDVTVRIMNIILHFCVGAWSMYIVPIDIPPRVGGVVKFSPYFGY